MRRQGVSVTGTYLSRHAVASNLSPIGCHCSTFQGHGEHRIDPKVLVDASHGVWQFRLQTIHGYCSGVQISQINVELLHHFCENVGVL